MHGWRRLLDLFKIFITSCDNVSFIFVHLNFDICPLSWVLVLIRKSCVWFAIWLITYFCWILRCIWYLCFGYVSDTVTGFPQAIVIGIYCIVRRNLSITKALKKTQILWMPILCILCVLVLPFSALWFLLRFHVRLLSNLFLWVVKQYIMQLNHIFRTRDLVRKNDAKISKHQGRTKEDILPGDGFLDQGFTRPKVYWPASDLWTYKIFKG